MNTRPLLSLILICFSLSLCFASGLLTFLFSFLPPLLYPFLPPSFPSFPPLFFSFSISYFPAVSMSGYLAAGCLASGPGHVHLFSLLSSLLLLFYIFSLSLSLPALLSLSCLVIGHSAFISSVRCLRQAR